MRRSGALARGAPPRRVGRDGDEADVDEDDEDPLLAVDGEDGREEGAEGRDADGLPPPRVTALPLDGVPEGRGRCPAMAGVTVNARPASVMPTIL
ncbi:MAG TPA: hypothetical protein VFK20_14015 [Vicinamibacterales bacterium]|nr:hypothetical protein [Vicinamibacterales bacterium]